MPPSSGSGTDQSLPLRRYLGAGQNLESLASRPGRPGARNCGFSPKDPLGFTSLIRQKSNWQGRRKMV